MKKNSVMKCAFCSKKTCKARYKAGKGMFYSGLGFVKIRCPNEPKKDPYTQEIEKRREEIKNQPIKGIAENDKKVRRIIVVDDNITFAKTLGEFLTKQDKSQCIVYTNPLEALEHIEDDIADIFVTACEMWNMDGFELAEMVLKKRPNIRVVVMSSRGTKYLGKIYKKTEIYEKIDLVYKGDFEFFNNLI